MTLLIIYSIVPNLSMILLMQGQTLASCNDFCAHSCGNVFDAPVFGHTHWQSNSDSVALCDRQLSSWTMSVFHLLHFRP